MNRTRSAICATCLTAATLLLSACGSNSGYPSLAKRPAERITGSAQPVAAETATPPAPTIPDSNLQARLAGLQDQAREAHRQFSAMRGKVAQLTSAAKGAPVASEAWSVASIGLAQLESRRSQAMIALADLDSLYARARIDGDDGVTIAAARDQVTAWVADEDAVLADLRGQLAS
jgi:hypothetical protein